MADQYDAYRQNPNAAPDEWALGAGPQQFYGPSSSLWGNIRKGAAKGAVAGGLVPGVGSLAGAATGAVVTPFTQSFGGLQELKSGEMFKNFGKLDNWKNLASGGTRKKKDAQQQAKAQRAAAFAAWQNDQEKRYGDMLGQAGADVRNDLGGELSQALRGAGDNMGAIQNNMTAFQQRYQQYMLGRQRAGQARDVDALMSDPRRISDRNQRIAATRTQGMQGVADQYRMTNRNNAFDQARRGMQGSSVDVEQQGKATRARNTAAGQIQQGADEQAQQYRLGDQQTMAQLKGLIYSDDPNTAASLGATMQGLQSQGQQVQENAALKAQRTQLDSTTSTGLSQALGGAMSAGAKPLEYYLSNQGGGA